MKKIMLIVFSFLCMSQANAFDKWNPLPLGHYEIDFGGNIIAVECLEEACKEGQVDVDWSLYPPQVVWFWENLIAGRFETQEGVPVSDVYEIQLDIKFTVDHYPPVDHNGNVIIFGLTHGTEEYAEEFVPAKKPIVPTGTPTQMQMALMGTTSDCQILHVLCLPVMVYISIDSVGMIPTVII